MIYFWLKLSGRYDLVNISPRQTNIFDFLSLKKLVCSGKYEAELNNLHSEIPNLRILHIPPGRGILILPAF